jgi:pilus assembly protein FimV
MGSRNTSSTIAAVTLALILPAGQAMALGFGEMRAQPLLGQPLNLALPVSLGDGETLSSECAGADIVAGESQVQPSNVRIRVTQGRGPGEAVLRISTTVPIDEPVLNVTVSAGCPTRITRTLVLLADPPLVNTIAPTVAAAVEPSARPGAASEAPPPAAAQGAGSDAAPRAPRTTRPAPPTRTTRTAAPRTTPSQSAAAASAPATATAAVTARTAPAAMPRPAAPIAGRPRLQLDGGQVGMGPAAAAADEQLTAARHAAAAAEAAASAAQQRTQALEAEMVQLRAAAKAQTAALDALRAQIASDQAQRQQQSWLIPLLLGALALLAGLAVWLAFRLRDQRSAGRTSAWWDKAGASVPATPYGGEPSEYGTSSLFKPSASAPLKPSTAAAPLATHEPSRFGEGLDSLIAPPTVPAPVPAPPAPAPVAPARDEVAESKRPVSVDEQIDLEQQADFFIALGHDESAIDLLMAHLRSTGGGTPLPFLKLLEIHRRRGDREAYERTRVRFNQRFNSVAPDWQADPKSGRSLDAYPLVVGRIQHAWPHPLDAMAELEALLFRRGAGSEMFDLPAYQEVLFLYQLARDLHQAEQPDEASNVDVLLPIGGAATAAASDGSIVLRPEFNDGRAVTLDLDLDLSGASRPGDLAPVPAAVDPVPEADFVLDLEGDAGESTSGAGANDFWSADPGDKRRDS